MADIPSRPTSTATRPSWHGRLFAWAWDILGFEPTPVVLPLTYCVTLVFAVAYLALTIAIWIVMNAGTLLFGVYTEPVWRAETRLRVLYLPRRIPVIAIAMPVLLIFSAVHSWMKFGAAIAIAPLVVTWGLAIGLFALLVAFNTINRKGRKIPS